MAHVLNRTIVMVWSVLIAASLFSVWLGTDHGIADVRISGAVLLVVAFVKVWLIGMHFMELRDAPRTLRLLFDGWCVTVGGAVTVLFILA